MHVYIIHHISFYRFRGVHGLAPETNMWSSYDTGWNIIDFLS